MPCSASPRTPGNSFSATASPTERRRGVSVTCRNGPSGPRSRQARRPLAASGSRDRRARRPLVSSRRPSAPSRPDPSNARNGPTLPPSPPDLSAKCRNGPACSSSRLSTAAVKRAQQKAWPPERPQNKLPAVRRLRPGGDKGNRLIQRRRNSPEPDPEQGQ